MKIYLVCNFLSFKNIYLKDSAIREQDESDQSLMVGPLSYFSFQPVLHN